MRLIALGALLYGLTMLGANAPAADLSATDRAALEALRQDEMAKLVLRDAATPAPAGSFEDGQGGKVSLADFAGKVVLVNFWATWCAPCRAEMLSIDRLAGEMAGPDLAVVPVSIDRGGADRVRRFYNDLGVTHLPVYNDRHGELARAAGAIGLPVSLILDRQGREIARLTGDAEWDSPEAKGFLARLIELTAPET